MGLLGAIVNIPWAAAFVGSSSGSTLSMQFTEAGPVTVHGKLPPFGVEDEITL